MKLLLTIFLIPIFCIISHAQNANKIDWVSDLEFLKQELPKKHYDLFFQLSKNDFEIGMDKIIADVPNLTDYAILDRLLQLVAKIGDSHTSIDFGTFNRADKLLPFRLYWFSDGLHITHAQLGYEKLLGKQLLSINGYAIEQIVDSLSTLIAIDNQATIKNTLPRMIGFLPHLECFGFVDNEEVVLSSRDLQGVESTTTISISDLKSDIMVRYEPDSMAFCWRHLNEFFVNQYFENDSILYVQYNTCWSRELERILGSRKRAKAFPSFNRFQKEVFRSIAQQPLKKIIFDLRFNGGGSSLQGTQMIRKLADYEQVNHKGKIFVITGKHTFSSGIINVLDFRENTQAIFVGEETSGRPNHYGEIKYLVLPSSGLKISYSTKYFRISEPDADAFYPDIKIETSFQDYNKGIDPVFEYIRTLK